MRKTLAFIGDYVGQFAFYGFGMGGLFGTVFGTILTLVETRELWGFSFGMVFGFGFGLFMGMGTGLICGIVARVFFYRSLGITYRRVIAVVAFVSAFIIGSQAVQAVLTGYSERYFTIVLLLSTAGGVGAAIAAHLITSYHLRATKIHPIAINHLDS